MRQVFLLDLRDESCASAYEECHRSGGVPTEVLADIRAASIGMMEIYRAGDRLAMVTQTPGVADPAVRVCSQASRDWEARMDRFQLQLPGRPFDEKWRPAQRVFDLSEYIQKGTKE